MQRQADSQYDDDLTVGIGGDHDDGPIDAGYVDLFEYSGEEESPIARLKTIVLSIDWEITDEVLTQFNEELLDLQDIWADDPIKLVYVQALQKISKYIFQQKANAHPSAIRLLLTLYYDLEKIVLDQNLSEDEKKEILRVDVKKFEQLKRQIEAEAGKGKKAMEPAPSSAPLSLSEEGAAHPVLFNLKACILGMDWEITERELSELSREVRRLEIEFAGNKPRMLFLQGIEALGGYIKLKRSDAHADAFKLLYSFYEGLEKIVVNDMTLEEEKAVLLPEVEKFEQFKKIISPTLVRSDEPDTEVDRGEAEEQEERGEGEVAPAFADLPEEVQGFQAEREAAELGESLPDDVESRLDAFFSEPGETEEPAPAEKQAPVLEEAASHDTFSQEAAEQVASFFDDAESKGAGDYAPSVSTEEALRGVDVETEADDDSDEDALPTEADGKLAPALADTGEELTDLFAEEPGLVSGPVADTATEELEARLDGFFAESEESPAPEAATKSDIDADTIAAMLAEDEDVAPALSFAGDDLDEGAPIASETVEGDLEDQLDNLFADHASEVPAALEGSDFSEDAQKVAASEEETFAWSDETEPALFASEESVEMEERLASFFEEPQEGDEQPRTALDSEQEVEEQVSAFFEEPEQETDVQEMAEDVVFAPAEEAEISGDEELPAAILEEEPKFSTFASESDEEEFFAAIDERVDEPGEFQMELLDEKEDIDTRAVFALEEAPSEEMLEQPAAELPAAGLTADVAADEEETYHFGSDDDLNDLRAGIASLGVEISDTIIEGILKAVNSLRHHFANRPAEKTFLQLISTIVQHIGQYRYEASAEAHGLLLSVFDKLELIQNPELPPDQALEVLLTETTKILQWQQTMLDRQAIRKGDELTFLSPVRSEQEPDSEEPVRGAEGEGLGAVDVQETVAPTGEQPDLNSDFSAVFEPVPEEEPMTEEGPDDVAVAADPAFLSLDEQPDFFAGAGGDGAVEETGAGGFPAEEWDTDEDIVKTEELVPPDEPPFLSLDDDPDFVVAADELIAADIESAGVGEDQGESETAPSTRMAPEEAIAEYVKKELEALRVSLQEELAELRKRLDSREE
ncbi:hypothetical protein [Desulfofustis limnaeus]|uniref:ImpA N-terminal domain-containing protein n=1 Tax=Desulfofustis limnaeus TaxID=2740163 RepID=A0ABM7W746_9BACT|nr:hypothetical protein [Desulfofustis limnaeus]MDX9894396.1 hypothetical protein [Desulfofustis sp.]BDD86739.1 hypothetical protein DPPLL_11040 [Desulfofustis limnaeus]